MGGHLSHLKPEVRDEVLQATCGSVRGNVYKHESGQTIDGYLGIPFAKPPVGELRFKKPEVHEVWTEVKDCTKYGPREPQDDNFAKMFGFEKRSPTDEATCLNLNVFTPRKESTEFHNSRPVMVFIHGGAYEMSASSDYCDYSITGTICQKDIVLVTINYRLGPFGFLTTGEDDCKGNFGLWDQTLALRWVQKHIASFGGDPNNVTIFGQSAGGGSVDLLSLSPHSRDLFHKVIPMSGNAHCEFAIRTKENEVAIFRDYAKVGGWDGEDGKSLLEWYKSQPAEELQCGIIPKKQFDSSRSGSLNFVPNLDGDFFPKPLDQLRKEAPKKPILAGVCEYEGLIFAKMDPQLATAKENFDSALVKTFRSDYSADHKQIQKEVYEYYTNGIDKDNEDDMTKQLALYLGDHTFNHGTYDLARVATKYGSDVYLYSFDFCNPEGFGIFAHNKPFLAASHCTELRYVLGEGVYSKYEPSSDDMHISELITQYFTNFAKYGSPNRPGEEVWEKYTSDKPGRYFKIQLQPKMVDNFQGGRMEFWDKIRAKSLTYNAIHHGKKL